MKKKLLAIVLSVVMIASLLVPMFMISANNAPTVTIGLGEVSKSGNYLLVPVLVSNNTSDFFAARYSVKSQDGLDAARFKNGTFEESGLDEWDEPYTITLGLTSQLHGDYVKVVQDSTVGTDGISAVSGVLGTAYFNAPTEVGTYTFIIEGVEANDVSFEGGVKNTTPYNVTVNPLTVTFTIECTSHTEVKDEEKSTAPKCGVPGEDVFKCSACGKELRRATVAALQHEWVKDNAASTPAECDVPGEDVFNCTQPGCPVGTERVPVTALDHSWDNGTVATNVACGSTADIHYECTRDGCDAFKDETGSVVPHNFVRDPANDVAAKCGTPGSEAYKCDRPNCPGGADSTKTVPTAALEHNWVKDDAASTAPICGTAGEDVFNCTQPGCPVGTERVPVAALDHNYKVNNAESYAATCITPGLTVKECDQPGCPAARVEEIIDATGVHVYDDGVELNRVCGEKIAIRYTCTADENCTDYYDEEGDVIEHDWRYSYELSEEPKCGVPGKDVYVCQNANCPVGTDEHPINALEHDFDYNYYEDMEVVTPPTVDEVGKAKVPCRHGCGETKDVDLEKLTNKVENDMGAFETEDAVLPEDITIDIVKGEEKDGKVEVEFNFSSNIVADLDGDVKFTLDIAEAKKEFTNFKVYKVNVDGTRTLVSEIKGDELIVNAALDDTLVMTYEEIPEESGKSPATGDTMNVVVLVAFALVAMIGLAVVSKKRVTL